MTYRQVNRRIWTLLSAWAATIIAFFIFILNREPPTWLVVIFLLWTVFVTILYNYWAHKSLEEK